MPWDEKPSRVLASVSRYASFARGRKLFGAPVNPWAHRSSPALARSFAIADSCCTSDRETAAACEGQSSPRAPQPRRRRDAPRAAQTA